jgi:hypothetical protein
MKGQDQVVDIELDKNTIIRAPVRDYTPIDSRFLWNHLFKAAPGLASSMTIQPDHTAESGRQCSVAD